jgi:hypothetical protein
MTDRTGAFTLSRFLSLRATMRPRMATKRRPGRPAISEHGRATALLQVRVHPHELAVYHEAAQREGLTVSEWVRRLCNAAVRRMRRR